MDKDTTETKNVNKNQLTNNDNYWIIDTSYNSNDRLVLPYLVKNLNVIAITTVSTNPNLSPLEIKLRIENDIGTNIPVFAGADRAYIDYQKELKDDKMIDPYNWKEYKSNITSNNNVNKNETIGVRLANKACVKIAEFVEAFGNKINILALGPLTNLSLAIVIDARLEKGFKNLYVIGSSYNNLGNSGTCAEYNFRCDPVASKNVILYYKNITLIPLEVEEQFKESKVFNKIENKDLNFIKEGYIKFEKNENNDNHSFLGIIGAIIAVNSSTIKESSSKPCDVDTIGRYTRGSLMVEKYEHIRKGLFNLVNIVDEINADEVLNYLNKIIV